MNDSRHCRTCGDTFEACACPSVVMTIADADAANTEIDTLRARVAKLEAALRDIADHSEPMSAEIARALLDSK